MSATEQPNEGRGLEAARLRRKALHAAMLDLEEAMSAPVASPAWGPRMGRAVAGIETALRAHVDEVEGHEGILAGILEEAPRLSSRVDTLRAEHDDLVDAMRRLRAAFDSMPASPDLAASAEVRSTALDLFAALARHRLKGADLVYDAYHVDIGGGS